MWKLQCNIEIGKHTKECDKNKKKKEKIIVIGRD